MTFPRAALLLTGIGLAYLGLALAGWVPGGWRMRNWIEPHQIREAQEQAQYRAARLNSFSTEVIQGEHPVVFLGSSTIERMPLERLAAPGTALNRGIAFESAQRLHERLGIGMPQDPGGFLIYVASIDHRFRGALPIQVQQRAKAVMNELQERWPAKPIALLGLLPEVGMDPARVQALVQANAHLRELCDVRKVNFVSLASSPLILDDGSLNPSLSSDGLHLNEVGYDHLWAALLEEASTLRAILQP